MEKHIVRYSYWLGVVCLVIAFVWRALGAIGVNIPALGAPAGVVTYMSAYKAAVLFFLLAIATSNVAWYQGHKP